MNESCQLKLYQSDASKQRLRMECEL